MSQIRVAHLRGDIELQRELTHDLKDIDEQIADLDRASGGAALPVCAFVSFEHVDTMQQLMRHYPHEWWQRVSCFGCCNRELLERFTFRPDSDEPMVFIVRQAPDPSNILFHNLSYTINDQRWRKLSTFLATLVALAVSFGVSIAATWCQNQLPKQADCSSAVYTYAQAQARTSPNALSCFCKQNLLNIYSDSSIRSLCFDWLQTYIAAYALTVSSAFVIAVLNKILEIVILNLVMLERHHSVTQEQSAIMLKLAVSMFLNTAVVQLLVNAKLFFSFGSFDDFSSDWYAVAGYSILITMFFNVLLPQIVNVIKIPYESCRRATKANDCTTQAELNELYSGTPFELASRYAAVLNTIFVTLLYSAGMPLLFPAAAASVFCTFWFDRTALFYLHSLPPKYDERLAQEVLTSLPLAVFLHCLFASWMYTAPSLNYPYSLNAATNSVGSQAVSSVYSSTTNSVGIAFRLFNWNGFPNFLLALIMFVRWLFLRVWNQFLGELWTSWCGSYSAKVVPMKAEKITFTEGIQEQVLTYYRASSQAIYANAFLGPGLGQLPPQNNVDEADGWEQHSDAAKQEMQPSARSASDGADDVKVPEPAPAQKSRKTGRIKLEATLLMSDVQRAKFEQQVQLAAMYSESCISCQCPNCFAQVRFLDSNTGEDEELICGECAFEFTA